MTQNELKYLVDVQIFVDELIEIVGTDKHYEDFNNNITYKRAVERLFELKGYLN